MNQIYINTSQNEETRIVVVENGKLVNYEQEVPGQENKKNNIYKGVVTSIQDSLEAAFVDFGDDKNGFLPLKEVPNYSPNNGGLKIGDSLLVQIKRDNIGNKGAGLTGFISLAGSYLVLQQSRNNRTMMSKHIDRSMRTQMQTVIDSLNVPDGMSVILRTSGLGRSEEELRWDLESYLLKLWDAIKSADSQIKEPTLIYHGNNMLLQVVRDYFRPAKNEIFCDSLESYEELKKIIQLMFPGEEEKVHYHDINESMIPTSIENQINTIFDRTVTTPSGISVVFDSTEALVAVDVNSGGLNNSGDIENTALMANMEAAEIIALHLRLRNLGGLIVVDFIDMEQTKNRQRLKTHLEQLLRRDKARVRSTDISMFGLVEISRQRMSRSLVSSLQTPCENCGGTGVSWRTEAFALRLLRRINAIAMDNNIGALLVQAPADTAIYLLNEKRIEIRKMEDIHNCDILIAPDESLYPPQCNIKPIKGSGKLTDSYRIVQKQKDDKLSALRKQLDTRHNKPSQQDALLQSMLPDRQAPANNDKKGSFFNRVLGALFPKETTTAKRRGPQNKPKAANTPPVRETQQRKTTARSSISRQAQGSDNGQTRRRRNAMQKPNTKRKPIVNAPAPNIDMIAADQTNQASTPPVKSAPAKTPATKNKSSKLPDSPKPSPTIASNPQTAAPAPNTPPNKNKEEVIILPPITATPIPTKKMDSEKTPPAAPAQKSAAATPPISDWMIPEEKTPSDTATTVTKQNYSPPSSESKA